MKNFLETNPEIFLLDPNLFEEHFSISKFKVPVFIKNDKLYLFVKSNFIISENQLQIFQKIIDQDLLSEKLYLIINYKKWQKDKCFSKESPVRSIIEFILIESILNNVSDIHFNISNEHECIVKFKKETVLYHFCTLSKLQFESVLLSIKVLSSLDTANRYLPQSSSFSKIFKGESFDFRFSTHPTFFGERFVIRILSRKNILNFNQMGLTNEVMDIVNKIVDFPNGLVLFTGPTNSGKTTLIHSIISKIAEKNLTVMTLEDPIEYRMPNIVQTNISDNGLSYYEGMKSILRQDPDVIFLGEIRDSKIAKIAIQAALTGHKVLSTLHAYSIKGSITRLLDMGISNVMLAESLISVFSQRLLRKTNKNNEFLGLTLLVDALFLTEDVKDKIRENNLASIENNLRKNAEELVRKKIINESEIKRTLG